MSGDPVGAVESVKSASDIYSPVSGEIVEVNTMLEGKPGLINEDPYGKGMFNIQLFVNLTAGLYADHLILHSRMAMQDRSQGRRRAR